MCVWLHDPFSLALASYLRFLNLTHTLRHTVELLWTSDQPVEEASTYTGQHKRETSMPRTWFEPAISATKRPQTYALDRAALGSAINILPTIIRPTVVKEWGTLLHLCAFVTQELSGFHGYQTPHHAPTFDWYKFFIKHFGAVEATRLKIMASRSPLLAWPPLNFMKICHLVQKLLAEDTDGQIERQTGDLISSPFIS
jgi:hypothetical protein